MHKIFKFLNQNKVFLFTIIGIGIVLSLTPLSSAQAWPSVPNPFDGAGDALSDVVNGLKNVFNLLFGLPILASGTIVVFVFSIMALTSSLLFSLIILVLTWLTSEILLIGITPTNSSTINAITETWNITRGLANIFFIVILVFIGLATILRIKEYEAKKALPVLIIIALLINFTPVIIGFVVDMSNIVTAFFLNETTDSIANISEKLPAVEGILSFADKTWQSLQGGDITIGTHLPEISYRILHSLIITIFYGFASLVFGLVILIFFYRIVMLWILTVLSPIAFFSRAIKGRKEVNWLFPGILNWDKWWEELIKWAIVGIPIGFFLLLSSKIISAGAGQIFAIDFLSEENANIFGIFPSSDTSFSDFIVSMLAPGLGLAMLGIGITISMESMPSAAKGIMDYGKKAGQGLTNIGTKALKKVAGKGAGALAGGLGVATGLTTKLTKGIEKRTEDRPILGGLAKLMVTKPTNFITGQLQKNIGGSLQEFAAEQDKLDIPKNFKDWEDEDQDRHILSLSSGRNRIRLISKANESTKKNISPKLKNQLIQDIKENAGDKKLKGSIDDIVNYHSDLIDDPETRVELETSQAMSIREKSYKYVKEGLTPSPEWVQKHERVKKAGEWVQRREGAREIGEKAGLFPGKEKSSEIAKKKREVREEIEKETKKIKAEMNENKEFKAKIEEDINIRFPDLAGLGPAEQDKKIQEELKIIATERIIVRNQSVKNAIKGKSKRIGYRLGMQDKGWSVINALVKNGNKKKIENIFNGTGGLNGIMRDKNGKIEKDREMLIERISRKNKENPEFLRNMFNNKTAQNLDFDMREILKEWASKNGFKNYKIEDDQHGSKAYAIFARLNKILEELSPRDRYEFLSRGSTLKILKEKNKKLKEANDAGNILERNKTLADLQILNKAQKDFEGNFSSIIERLKKEDLFRGSPRARKMP